MWFYLFGRNEKYPDPLAEIKSLADLSLAGDEVYLKLSSRDDASLKNAKEGEIVYLCTRDHGQWLVHGDAVLIGDPIRGETPESMSSVYGATHGASWWRRLHQVCLYPKPKGEVDLGLTEGTLPTASQAHVIHLPTSRDGIQPRSTPNSTSNALARLTDVMDEAWDAGRLAPEQIDEAIRRFREVHPYGR
jgi:hypothetical protein